MRKRDAIDDAAERAAIAIAIAIDDAGSPPDIESMTRIIGAEVRRLRASPAHALAALRERVIRAIGEESGRWLTGSPAHSALDILEGAIYAAFRDAANIPDSDPLRVLLAKWSNYGRGAPRHVALAELLAATDKAIGPPEHFTCPDHGAHVAADEDGYCLTCGVECKIEACKCAFRDAAPGASASRVEALEAALRFYAVASNYWPSDGPSCTKLAPAIEADEGQRARDALAAPSSAPVADAPSIVALARAYLTAQDAANKAAGDLDAGIGDLDGEQVNDLGRKAWRARCRLVEALDAAPASDAGETREMWQDDGDDLHSTESLAQRASHRDFRPVRVRVLIVPDSQPQGSES